MECKRCKRCGCFLTTDADICMKCQIKDNAEIANLHNYLNQNPVSSFDEIASNVGITPANLNRFIAKDEFIDVYKKLNNTDIS